MEENALYVLAHIGSTFESNDLSGSLTREGAQYCLRVDGKPTEIFLRVPENTVFSCAAEHRMENGYAVLRHPGGAVAYSYTLTPQLTVLRADARVPALAGKVCVERGSVVYCAEEADNGAELCALRVPAEPTMTLLEDDSILLKGYRAQPSGALYSSEPERLLPVDIRLRPYHTWGNRGEGEMRVWLQRM